MGYTPYLGLEGLPIPPGTNAVDPFFYHEGATPVAPSPRLSQSPPNFGHPSPASPPQRAPPTEDEIKGCFPVYQNMVAHDGWFEALEAQYNSAPRSPDASRNTLVVNVSCMKCSSTVEVKKRNGPQWEREKLVRHVVKCLKLRPPPAAGLPQSRTISPLFDSPGGRR
ncbi:hypothetical protein MNV49_002754 [Pseudohyphozyma bogoriensis]|nr:hypothetical protein MNV49_002754 [Pseudohyphozyma bogoriensis]